MDISKYNQDDFLYPNANDSLQFNCDCLYCLKDHGFVGNKIVWGNGKRDADLMIVGMDSGGEDENERLWRGSRITLMPLTNIKTGLRFRRFLNAAGIKQSLIYTTNSVKCNVGYSKLQPLFSKWKDPKKKIYKELSKKCIIYLDKEIEIIKPETIITLGGEVKDVLNCLIEETIVLPIDGLEYEVMFSPPLRCKFKNGIKTDIFQLYHPSPLGVKGKKQEEKYIKNLSLIWGRIN